jgi:predicted O-linked N-acetylglucosamine transferase (SPINDLY family)
VYRKIIKILPDVRDAINLGALLRQQGRLQEACAHYKEWLNYFGEDNTLRVNAANAMRDMGLLQESEAVLLEGIRLHPTEPRLLHGLAKTLINARKTKEAQKILADLSRTYPEDISIGIDLGRCLHRMERLEEALHVFQGLSKRFPEDTRCIANSITIFKDLGRFTQANELLRDLSESTRSSQEIRLAEAQLLMAENRHEDAATAWQELCRSNPEEPLHWLNLGACLKGLKNMVASFQTLREGYKWHPQDTNLMQSLGQSLAELGRFDASIQLLKQSSEASDRLPDSHLFNLQFLGGGYGLLGSAEREKLALDWERRKIENSNGALWADLIREPLDGRTLKIGYLSADFCNHPVGRFVLPILEAHKHEPIEVWGISCGSHHDDITESIKAACTGWIDIRYESDQMAARLLSDLKLDVIVELGGYTAGSRLGVLTHKPAPIQLSYLGFFAPTYLKCIDGWVGDQILFEKLNNTDRSTHKLINISGGYMCLQACEEPDITLGSKIRRFRFGSFNNSRKITPETVRLWSRILETCNDAELVLKSVSFVEPAEQLRIRKLFIDAGITEKRVLILPWANGWLKHMECYAELDVALDPVPYGGATTTVEALMMGVPVICLHGEGMVGALTASILHFSGLTDIGIARDHDQYLRLAADFAQKGPRGLLERTNLRKHVLESPLANPKRLSRELVTHYRLLTSSKEYSRYS